MAETEDDNTTRRQRDAERAPSITRRTYSIEETAVILGLSRASAYNYAKTGILPVIRLGKRLIVPAAAIERMLTAEAAV
jgi:predicted DNA-binding transcriptional regulator AlpA